MEPSKECDDDGLYETPEASEGWADPSMKYPSGVARFFYSRAVSIPPIIVVGMHRSGTALLARLLERCGVFMGDRQTKNGESVFFQTVNREALDSFGCSWRCLDFLPETARLRNHYQWLHAVIAERMKRDLVAEHWGRRTLSLLRRKATPWGWKDPRNSLLLPVWKQVFPQATVVHIFRDGRDVALSLLIREIKRERENIFGEEEMRGRFVADMRLWENYIRRIQDALPLFEKHHTLQYERLLSAPLQEVERLVQTLDIPVQIPLEEVVSIVEPSPAKRHEKQEFRWTHGLADDSQLLEELGYTTRKRYTALRDSDEETT